MIERDTPEFEELIGIYLIANTPAYLFRRYRASQFIQRLGKSSKPLELAEEIVKFLALDKPSLLDVVSCFAAATALASKTPSEVRSVIDALPKQRPSWLDEVLHQSSIARPSTTYTSIDLPRPQPVVEQVPLNVKSSINIAEVKIDHH